MLREESLAGLCEESLALLNRLERALQAAEEARRGILDCDLFAVERGLMHLRLNVGARLEKEQEAYRKAHRL